MKQLRMVYWAVRAMWWALFIRLRGLPQEVVEEEVRRRLAEHGVGAGEQPVVAARVGAPGFLLRIGPKDINMGPPTVYLTPADMDVFWGLWQAVGQAHGGSVIDKNGYRAVRVSVRRVLSDRARGRQWPCGKCGPCRAVKRFEVEHKAAYSRYKEPK